MKTSDMFPSKYVSASEIDESIEVMIDRVTMEEVGQDKEDLPVVHFADYPKGLVLNKTNTKKIASLHGTDTADWTDKPIKLIKSETAYKGEEVECIRIREADSIPQ